MLYKFDIDLLKNTKENGLIKILDKEGNELSIASLGTDKDGNIIFTLSN